MNAFIFGLIATVIVSASFAKFGMILRKKKEDKDDWYEKNFKEFSTAKECLVYFKVTVPENYVIFHKDGNKKNNTFINLEVITRKEMLDKIRWRK